MSNRAALYLRSSKDRSDISIDSQRRALHELATSRALVVVEEFDDAVESGKDEDRPGFQSMIRALRRPDRGWEHVLVLDTSRIARRRHIALIFEHECDKANIRIHFKNVPDSDPISNMLLKSILQAMDEWHSLTSKAKGLAGMAENVRQGWRAGGRAPRGYRLEYHGTGAIRDGAPVLKSKLVESDDAPLVAKYLSARAAGKSRGDLVARLKLTWPAASLNPMEWQALTYAGHTVWNVSNERTAEGYRGGEKRKPRADWVITENTHPALITQKEAEAILSQLDKQKTVRTRTTDRPHLLSGMLFSPDGDPWHGERDKKMDAGLYRLGKGKKISARRVDKSILDRVLEDLQSDQAVEKILAAMNHLVDEPVDGRTIVGLEKRLDTLTKKSGKLIDLLTDADGPAVDAYKRTISQTESERGAVIDELAAMRKKLELKVAAKEFTPADARRLLRLLFLPMQEGIDGGDVKTIKAALGGLIDRITLDPVSEACAIHYRIASSDTGLMLASPREGNLTPVTWQSNIVIMPKWAT